MKDPGLPLQPGRCAWSRTFRLAQVDETYRVLDRGQITGRAIVVM